MVFILGILLSCFFSYIFIWRERLYFGENLMQIYETNYKTPLEIDTEKKIQKFTVEVADTDTKRELGLMYRTQMKDEQGMLFIFPDEQIRQFWMKNTNLSLDILFIDKSGIIISVVKDAKPNQISEIYSSQYPAQYALELNNGSIDKFNIQIGDKISFKL